MSQFRQAPGRTFQNRDINRWFSGGEISGDLFEWNANLSGFGGVLDGANVIADLEPWTSDVYAGGHVEGDMASVEGELFGPGTISGTMQFFNAIMWGNRALITANFQPFNADPPGRGLQAQFNYNTLYTDLPEFTCDMYGGGNVDAGIQPFSSLITGFVGMTFGMNGGMHLWDCDIYAGAHVAEPEMEPFTCEMIGDVSHIERITASFFAFSGELTGESEGIAEVQGDMYALSGRMTGIIGGPGDIVGSMKMFSGFMNGIPGDLGFIEGDLFPWGADSAIKGLTGAEPYIEGSWPPFAGELTAEGEECSFVFEHNRGAPR